jgi:cell division transport system permease protein
MTARTFFNSIREGFLGMLRHPLVTLASVSTILLMLLIMSVFIIFSADARYIMRNVGQQPPIEVFMALNGTEQDRTAVAQYLAGETKMVLFYEASSPEQNYNQYKINLGSNASLLDDFDYNQYLPYTFRVQLVDPSYADEVVMRLEAYPGVHKVMQEKQVMIILSKMSDWVNIATATAFFVLFLISLFIISNMVRISVYSRATEISIMKYIGATNSYIRLPFIVEGAMVGLVSAVCAWGIAYLAYSQLYERYMNGVEPGSFYSILPMGSLSGLVFLVCAFSGILIGAFGSGVSVRKYIQV